MTTRQLVHSALWHARRAQPGGENRPRYFADASYCQAGIRWPAYGNRVWQEVLAKARELGLDCEGRYAHLFVEDRYVDAHDAIALLKTLEGSLVLHLRDWKE